MPELPDLTIYVEAIEARAKGAKLERAIAVGPFFLRTVDPPLSALESKRLLRVSRVGKRIALHFEGDLVALIHLMILGRLHWKEKLPKLTPRTHLAAFVFETGVLVATEAGSKKRASLHVLAGAKDLAALDAGGVEPLETDLSGFSKALFAENHTLKRALTDPRLFAGIGNAYSDEILHAARLSPMKLTRSLSSEETARLHEATRRVLLEWTERLRLDFAGRFPEKVTAFRPGMAVHGRFGEPCPVCGSPVQRIAKGESESNYCVTCQTGGRVLADRSLSRLLRDDWPRTLDELETKLGPRGPP